MLRKIVLPRIFFNAMFNGTATSFYFDKIRNVLYNVIIGFQVGKEGIPMSSFKIRMANKFARNSCNAWQSSGVIRRFSRWAYRRIMEKGATDYPYADPEFANWPEDDSKDHYTLISDSAGFVIRRSTSYIAWKIKCTTGKWPTRPEPGERAPGEHAFDAKHWGEILEHNGWKPYGPVTTNMARVGEYIGVVPGEGEFGLVVWLEEVLIVSSNGQEKSPNICWRVSTYEDFQKVYLRIPYTDDPSIRWYGYIS